MASANIVALTNAAAFAPDALFYMALSPFGVTDDRKITGSTLFTTIEPLNNNTAALVVTNSAVPTVPQVVFTNSGGTKRMQVSMAGAAGITDTFDEVSIFSSVAALTLSMGIWNAIDTGEAAEFYLYTGAAGLNHTRLRSVDPGATNVNWLDIASSGVLMASNASPGGLILLTDLAAPIVFVTGGTALGNEKGRFDAAGFTLGHVSTITGALNLANAASAFLTTITAGNAAAARTYVWPTNFGASGSVLTDAAGNGTLSWAVPAAGGMAIGGTVTSGTAGSVLFVNAGPILAQDNANFFWDDTNNRLGLGTATPGKLLHVNGIAQLGTVSATTGQLQLANSASANLTTIQAGNAAAAITYTWPLNVGAAGAVLTDAAGDGTLSWAAASGSGTVNAGTQFQMAYYATSAAAVSGLSNLVTDASGTLSHAATARSTGAPTFYNRIVTPADTGLTASTETVGIQFGGNTSAATVIRQHATGALTNQREYLFVAPTYSFVGASTITRAATVAITAAPITGTSATITNPIALWVQSGDSWFTSSGVGSSTIRVNTSDGLPKVQLGTLVGSSGNGSIYLGDVTPSGSNYTMYSNGLNEVVLNIGSATGLITFRLNGSNAPYAMAIDGNQNNSVGINTTGVISAKLHVINTLNQTTVVGFRVDSAPNTSVDLLQFNLNVDDTATVANLATYSTNSNTTAAAGFGSSFTFRLESSTTNDQNAAAMQWTWTDATHATRTADIVFQNVHLAAALATTFTIRSNGYYLWLGAKRTSAQFDKTDETLANITGLSVNVAAGRTYAFEATLYTTSNVAGGVKFAIAGTATATAITYEAVDCQGGLTVATGTQRAAALATAVGDITAVTTAYVRITGTITVNAAGTLTVQSARNAAVGTTSVLIGSVFIVNEIS